MGETSVVGNSIEGLVLPDINNRPFLYTNITKSRDILRDKSLTPTERQIACWVLQAMSNRGQCIYDDKWIMADTGIPYSSFNRAVNGLINKKIASRDVFGNLYIIGCQYDARTADVILSWSDLINHLADNTDFHSRSKDECWLWAGRMNEKGYGIIQVGVHEEMAHRLSYKCFNGKIGKRQEIHHTCKNPACVNPRHLKAERADRHHELHANERENVD